MADTVGWAWVCYSLGPYPSELTNGCAHTRSVSHQLRTTTL